MIQNSCLPSFKRWKRWKRWKGQRNRQHFATLHPHIYWPSKKYENMKAFCEPSSWHNIYIWYYEWANTANCKILFKSYRFVNTKSFPIFKSLFTCWWDNVFIGIKKDFLRKYFVFLTKSISIFFVLIVLMEEGGGIWQGLSLLTLSTIPFSTMALTPPPPSPPIGCFTRGRTWKRLGTTADHLWRRFGTPVSEFCPDIWRIQFDFWPEPNYRTALTFLNQMAGTTPQRPKNPGSRVALLPGKFLRVRTDGLKTVRTVWKLSGLFEHCPDGLNTVRRVENCPDSTVLMVKKLSGLFRNCPDCLETVRTV